MSHSEALLYIRRKLGLTQSNLASLLSMSQSSYCNCESGIRNLSLKKCYALIKIAKLKDIQINLESLRPEI